jgi:hypothetical protein
MACGIHEPDSSPEGAASSLRLGRIKVILLVEVQVTGFSVGFARDSD